jgi:predicted metal-dependent enzyme (double-stranded beta helix superfamily)
MPANPSPAARRSTACRALLRKAHAIIDPGGATPAALEQVKALLIGLAGKADLFPMTEFAPPVAQARNYMLGEDGADGFGLYLTINMPGKVAAPHDHGIWCVNAGISGVELHRFFQRTDDGSVAGRATVDEITGATVGLGTGVFMADHDIHATEVIGNQPAIGLALYGYALARFPSVVWFHPEFESVRALPSRRALVDA